MVYFFLTYIGQLIQQGKAIYIAHLNWYEAVWSPSVCIAYVNNLNEVSDWIFIDLCPNPDWCANGLTIGLVLGANIVFHSIFVILSNTKSNKYFKKDSQKKEKYIEQLQNED
jgi:hypothetical protein